MTLSFREFIDDVDDVVGAKVHSCSDKYFGDVFALTITYTMHLVLFFLDTLLWWIIWSVAFSIMRSFYLGLSIRTPWREIYTRLPKRIYSKLPATSGLEMKSKPKVRVLSTTQYCNS